MRPEIEAHLRRGAECLQAAQVMLDSNLPSDSVSRSYYAMFHAATAVLMKVGIERSSHGALIAAFSQFLVKPGLIDKRFHTLLRKAYEARSGSDYLPSAGDTLERGKGMLEGARQFVAACRELLASEP